MIKKLEGYAISIDGEIQLDMITKYPESTKSRYLRESMGWRFDHPDRYDREEAWRNIQSNGISIVPVVIEEKRV